MGGGGNHHQTKISTKYDKYADTTIHLDEQIEKHAYYRENLHKKFRWNRFSITRLFVWCFVIPLAIYQGTKIEYEQDYKRKRKDYLIKDGFANPFNALKETERRY